VKCAVVSADRLQLGSGQLERTKICLLTQELSVLLLRPVAYRPLVFDFGYVGKTGIDKLLLILFSRVKRGASLNRSFEPQAVPSCQSRVMRKSAVVRSSRVADIKQFYPPTGVQVPKVTRELDNGSIIIGWRTYSYD